jgi:pimeloyl-ACP methyl ester carboxylesterase
VSLVSKIIDVRGRQTEVLEAGAGDALVFLHGGSMMGGVDFLDAISDRFRVYAPFLPGYGATESEPFLESRDDTVDHLADVYNALGIERAVLVAHSLGAWRAVAFAARYPERVTRLVLAAPMGMEVPAHPVTDMLALTPVERLDVLTYDADIKASWMPAGGPDADYLAARGREIQSMGHFAPGPFDPSLPELVRSIDTETLLLWGEGDRLIPVAHAKVWAEAMPHATLRTYPGAGHLLFHERPETLELLTEGGSGGAT